MGIPLHAPLSHDRVRKEPRFQCVVCDRKFRTRPWVARHYVIHRIIPFEVDGRNRARYLPAFTHPSCWPAEENSWQRIRELTRRKEEIVWPGTDAPTADHVAYNRALHDLPLAALTDEEREAKQERKYLSMWWWLIQGQGEHNDLKDLLENGNVMPFNMVEDAGNLDLQHHGYAVPNMAPPSSDLEGSSASTPSQNSDLDALSSIGSTDYSMDRGWAPMPTAGDYDLLGSVENGRVVSEAVLHFISDTNIRFVGDQGEDFDSGLSISIAAKNLIEMLSEDEAIMRACEARMNGRQRSELDPDDPAGDREEAMNFREDRAFFYGLIQRACQSWFSDPQNNNNDNILLQHLNQYARDLGSEEGKAETMALMTKNRGQLQRLKAKKEQWRKRHIQIL